MVLSFFVSTFISWIFFEVSYNSCELAVNYFWFWKACWKLISLPFFFWFSVSMSTSDKHTSLDKSAEIEVFTTWKRICMNFLWLASFFFNYRCVFPPFTVSSKHPLLFLTKLNIWYEKSVIFKRKIIILSLAGLFMIFVFCLVCMLLTSTLYFILCVQSEYVIWNHIYFFNLYVKKIIFFFSVIYLILYSCSIQSFVFESLVIRGGRGVQ